MRSTGERGKRQYTQVNAAFPSLLNTYISPRKTRLRVRIAHFFMTLEEFENLVDTHRDEFLDYALYLIKRPVAVHDAEDIVSMAIQRSWERRDYLDSEKEKGSAAQWLKRRIRNAWKNWVRRILYRQYLEWEWTTPSAGRRITSSTPSVLRDVSRHLGRYNELLPAFKAKRLTPYQQKELEATTQALIQELEERERVEGTPEQAEENDPWAAVEDRQEPHATEERDEFDDRNERLVDPFETLDDTDTTTTNKDTVSGLSDVPDRRVWDTSEKLHNRQVLSSLEKAMFVLPDDKRLVILLRYYENKTQHEIAETLGWTRDKVQYQLEKALDTMRRFMSDDHPPDPDGGGISARPKESCETEKQATKTRAKHARRKNTRNCCIDRNKRHHCNFSSVTSNWDETSSFRTPIALKDISIRATIETLRRRSRRLDSFRWAKINGEWSSQFR